MPPFGRSSNSHAGPTTLSTGPEPYYSNEDIELLHQIVLRAQSLLAVEPLPTNALFSAYYSILAKLRVSPDHDNRYARVLFRIGGLRGPKSLYERFEDVLARMGIEIEFDRTEDERLAFSVAPNGISREEAGSNRNRSPNLLPNTHQRRNSESTVWELEAGNKVQKDDKRSNSIASVPYKNSRSKEIRENYQTRHKPSQPLEHSLIYYTHESKRHESNGTRLAPLPSKPVEKPLSTHAGLQYFNDAASSQRKNQATHKALSTSNRFHAPSNQSALHPPLSEEDTTTSALGLRKLPDSETVLRIKASLISNRRLAIFVKTLLQEWKTRAKQLQRDNVGLELIASCHYRKAVISAAVHNWRIGSQERRALRETEKYFENLENRTTRARDIFLCHVALTHWSKRASELSQQTAQARRQILLARTFNSWRELTTIDDSKVRCYIIKRLFCHWKRRTLFIRKETDMALQRHQSYCVQISYLRWIQQLREIRADRWQMDRVKQTIMSRWIATFDHLWQSQVIAETHRMHHLRMKSCKIWSTEMFSRVEREREAESYFNHKILLNVYTKWAKQSRIIPAQEAVEARVANRQLKFAFDLWLIRSRGECRAAKLDRLRIIDEAWVSWRLQTRTRMIRERVDIHIVGQAFYKWIVEARARLSTRVRNENCMRDTLQILKLKWQAMRKNRLEQEDLAQEILARKTQNYVLLRWYSSMGRLQQSQVLAANYNRPQLLQHSLSALKRRYQYIQLLKKWSRDAEFYLSVSKSLVKWKASTALSKREKRKAAYAQVRRLAKITLVRVILRNWCRKAQKVCKMQTMAENVVYNRAIIVGMGNFDRWRGCTRELVKLQDLCRERVLSKYTSVWYNRWKALRALEAEANIVYQEQQLSRILKNWALNSLQIRARSTYAFDIRDKNFKRNFRRIFGYWHQQTILREPEKREAYSDADFLGETNQDEAWSEYGENHEMEREKRIGNTDSAVLSTPLPGYLNTPSKKSERARAFAARYSTTPRAPLSTPLERELRDLWPRGVISSRRSRMLGHSKLGNRDLSDIPESFASKMAKSRGP
ncbi:Bgt-220 [Blumeria graminis f. sp. tritici]|uniref:Bgt-220 n=2 Tax=Blumeria graminis f. sp. tritici TaxID=62690 RepID=A0A061HFK7_BLUGR|nr:Sfi1 spindle body protein [Blumeria graminis f. sp. tritici 96224]VDB88284.1 Bgt-220 [Blumeria graminis f. sp. tritici]